MSNSNNLTMDESDDNSTNLEQEDQMKIMASPSLSPSPHLIIIISPDHDNNNNNDRIIPSDTNHTLPYTHLSLPPQTNCNNSNNNNSNDNNHNEDPDEEKLRKELQHLHRRIKNIQESIQLSSTALCIPSNWEQNCLFAVYNCVVEWRSILKHYSNLLLLLQPTSSAQQTKETSLKIFGLIQLALQCGPLKGAKPGYFKRCGYEVSQMAFQFLNNLSILCQKQEQEHNGNGDGDVDFVTYLQFTEKQDAILKKWIKDSEKACSNSNKKEPSKSVLKLREKATRGKGKR